MTLGRGSLGAFVLHVYGLLILSYVPDTGQVWSNALMQVLLIVAIATLLTGMKRWRTRPPTLVLLPRLSVEFNQGALTGHA